MREYSTKKLLLATDGSKDAKLAAMAAMDLPKYINVLGVRFPSFSAIHNQVRILRP
jgi:hypothetical protein